MNILIVYAHPNKKSFNAALKEAVIEQLKELDYDVRVRDLYEIQFDPVLKEDNYTEFYQTNAPEDILYEQKEISWADVLIYIFPTWWTGMPAIMKGYFDKVFTNGFAFRFTEKGAVGLLDGKRALIFQTTGLSEEDLKPKQLIAAMETSFDLGILHYCGVNILTHKFYYSLPYLDQDSKKRVIQEVKDQLIMI
ncbi:flavodoxin family protein [Bacillus lacus]|uniref:Flavodoxin family protein n=1 Tax=Metabacillus lacus TaxID=1983721 RepID=A0A7X2M0E8_9BACI|nr:NAD(P)H-dependent oxidoreductase [Metabacillus lacus]MRX74033.1 flavodoxin family protein [Metabacillus lacus]